VGVGQENIGIGEMQKIILDSNIVYNYPELLSFSIPGKKVIVLDIIKNEIEELSSKHKRLSGVPHLIAQSAERNIISIDSVPFSREFNRGFSPGFSTVDSLLVTYIKERKEKGDEIALVTDDKELQHHCTSIGIDVLSSSDLRKETKKIESADIEINKTARDISRRQIIYLITSFIFGIISSVIASLIYANLDIIIRTINIWGTIIALPLIGIIMFIFRGRYRLFYGVFEFMIGFLIGMSIFYPDFTYNSLDSASVLKLIGGLYVIVRGLDNMGKGIKRTKIESFWNKLSKIS